MANAEEKHERGDERWQGREARREIGRHDRNASRGALAFGLFLVTVGVLFLINNLFPQYGFGRLWPVLIIGWGAAILITSVLPPFRIFRLMQGLLVGVIGVVLLYNTLGLVPFEFWLNVINLWPVLLIALGLSILAGAARSTILALLPSLIILGALIAGLFYPSALFTERNVATFTPSRELPSGVISGSAKIVLSAGRFTLGATDQLYELRAKEYARANEPRVTYERSGSRADIAIRPTNRTVFIGSRQRTWDLRLARDIDWALAFEAGVADANLDLSDLKVRNLQLNGGVGDVRVRFGDKRTTQNARIRAGVSNFTLLVPRAAGVRMTRDAGLTSVRFKNLSVRKLDGGDYESAGFDRATKKLLIDINAGVSNITVEGY